jgi:hypothetical protein
MSASAELKYILSHNKISNVTHGIPNVSPGGILKLSSERGGFGLTTAIILPSKNSVILDGA